MYLITILIGLFMPLFVRIFILFLIFSSSLSFASTSVLTFGVRAYNGEQEAFSKWNETINYLQDHSDYVFRLKPVSGFDEMKRLVASGELDFVITQSLESVELRDRFSSKIFLTMVNRHGGSKVAKFSSVIFTRSDKASINTLEDIRGKKFAAIHPKGFGGYLMAARELKRVGLEPGKDFINIFTGTQNRAFMNVMGGLADVGTVRTGLIESFIKKSIINAEDIKIINQYDDGFPMKHSTELYPEWGVLAMKDVDNSVVSFVKDKLLFMPDDHPALKSGGYAGWIKAVNYRPVYDLMVEMGIGSKEGSNIGETFKDMKFMVVTTLFFIFIMTVAYFYIRKRKAF